MSPNVPSVPNVLSDHIVPTAPLSSVSLKLLVSTTVKRVQMPQMPQLFQLSLMSQVSPTAKSGQRLAAKYVLVLPFICDQTCKDRLMELNLLPISYWLLALPDPTAAVMSLTFFK